MLGCQEFAHNIVFRNSDEFRRVPGVPRSSAEEQICSELLVCLPLQPNAFQQNSSAGLEFSWGTRILDQLLRLKVTLISVFAGSVSILLVKVKLTAPFVYKYLS